MDSKQTDICTDEVIEENLTEEEENERVEAAMRKVARRRGAAKPVGAFARSDWFWTWSKGVDLLDAVYIESHEDPEGEDTEPKPYDALGIARARLNSEVNEICDAAAWNINEYRKIFHVTLAELALAIDVSESTLRKKMKDGTLTLKEFLTLCAVCLTDPCVILGYVDSEDIKFVQALHYLDKASDHRAVGELVEVLANKQNGRNMIRRSVSPIVEQDLGWDDDETIEDGDVISDNASDLNWSRVLREMLPSWPLWWRTDFDYTEFNLLVDAYLQIANHGQPWVAGYEAKAEAAAKVVKALKARPEIRGKFDQCKRIKETITELEFDGNEQQANSLKGLAHELGAEFARMLYNAANDIDDAEEDED